MIGQRYNSWTILSEPVDQIYKNRTYQYVLCKCDCGFQKFQSLSALKLNRTKQCKSCYHKNKTGSKFSPRKNLSGKIFGRLTVLENNHTIKNTRYWLCRCDCGNETFVSQPNLLREINSTRSCGKHNLKSEHHSWNGYKQIYGSFWNQIKNGATARNIELNISIQEAWELLESQNHKCALSNEEISLGTSLNRGTASLDRIDSTKPYSKSNCQWVHKNINMMKGKLDQTIFITWCKKISMHSEMKHLQNS